MKLYYANVKDVKLALIGSPASRPSNTDHALNIGCGHPVLTLCDSKMYGFNSVAVPDVLYATTQNKAFTVSSYEYAPDKRHRWAIGLTRLTSKYCLREDADYTLVALESPDRTVFAITSTLDDVFSSTKELADRSADGKVFVLSNKPYFERTPSVLVLAKYSIKSVDLGINYSKFSIGGRPAWRV